MNGALRLDPDRTPNPTGRGAGAGRKTEATANPPQLQAPPNCFPPLRYRLIEPAVDALAPMPIAFHVSEHERTLVVSVARV